MKALSLAIQKLYGQCKFLQTHKWTDRQNLSMLGIKMVDYCSENLLCFRSTITMKTLPTLRFYKLWTNFVEMKFPDSIQL